MPRVTENCLNSSIRSSDRSGLLPGTDKRGATLASLPYGIHPCCRFAERSLHLQ